MMVISMYDDYCGELNHINHLIANIYSRQHPVLKTQFYKV
jgi:hypothetical protein